MRNNIIFHYSKQFKIDAVKLVTEQGYTDGVERQEIWINKKDADHLPHKNKMRIPIKLHIADESFDAGIRSTQDTEYVWICPDMRDSQDKKHI